MSGAVHAWLRCMPAAHTLPLSMCCATFMQTHAKTATKPIPLTARSGGPGEGFTLCQFVGPVDGYTILSLQSAWAKLIILPDELQ